MINLLYCAIDKLQDDQLSKYLQSFQETVRAEIIRYQLLADRKSRMLGKLMLQYALDQEGCCCSLQQVQRTSYGKPFLPNWKPFNISHSGNWVVLCYGNETVGIDIEKADQLFDRDIIRYLHPDEQLHIAGSTNAALAFYDIWVKKEAVLKAIGKGITYGLAEFSCVNDRVAVMGERWYLHKIHLHEQYICYICHQHEENEVAITEFDCTDYKGEAIRSF